MSDEYEELDSELDEELDGMYDSGGESLTAADREAWAIDNLLSAVNAAVVPDTRAIASATAGRAVGSWSPVRWHGLVLLCDRPAGTGTTRQGRRTTWPPHEPVEHLHPLKM